LPEHFHLLRLKFSGLFGSAAAFVCFFFWAALLAQYASPFAVPGLTRGPPSDALPACPYLTVFFRPVFGFVTTFDFAFFAIGFASFTFSA
jgi:hypothetical protein